MLAWRVWGWIEGQTYLAGSLGEDLVLLEDAVLVCLAGDIEEGDAFDGGHFGVGEEGGRVEVEVEVEDRE